MLPLVYLVQVVMEVMRQIWAAGKWRKLYFIDPSYPMIVQSHTLRTHIVSTKVDHRPSGTYKRWGHRDIITFTFGLDNVCCEGLAWF